MGEVATAEWNRNGKQERANTATSWLQGRSSDVPGNCEEQVRRADEHFNQVLPVSRNTYTFNLHKQRPHFPNSIRYSTSWFGDYVHCLLLQRSTIPTPTAGGLLPPLAPTFMHTHLHKYTGIVRIFKKLSTNILTVCENNLRGTETDAKDVTNTEGLPSWQPARPLQYSLLLPQKTQFPQRYLQKFSALIIYTE